MSDGWNDLKTITSVADAQLAGWEVQVKDWASGLWIPWGGGSWINNQQYRGRPRQQAVVYECYDVGGRLEWWHQDRHAQKPWTRLPQFDKIVEAAE
jgi:hypothetical protein